MNGGPSQYSRQVIDVAARNGISTGKCPGSQPSSSSGGGVGRATPTNYADEHSEKSGCDIAAMRACIAEQHRYLNDPEYARQSDEDRAARQAAVYQKMDMGIARYWAIRKPQGESC